MFQREGPKFLHSRFAYYNFHFLKNAGSFIFTVIRHNEVQRIILDIKILLGVEDIPFCFDFGQNSEAQFYRGFAHIPYTAEICLFRENSA